MKASRHERNCRICHHPCREEIERDFCEWKPLSVISRERKLSRAALYRHLHSTGMFPKRDANIKAVLARMLEAGYRVKPSAAVIVAVVQAYAKINSSGEWIDKTENVNAANTKELFSRMNRGEMLRYAETGELPAWWPETLRRAAKDSSD
jgi:hypothetical protein